MYLADMILLYTNAEATERAAVHDPRLLHAEVPREQDIRRDAGPCDTGPTHHGCRADVGPIHGGCRADI